MSSSTDHAKRLQAGILSYLESLSEPAAQAAAASLASAPGWPSQPSERSRLGAASADWLLKLVQAAPAAEPSLEGAIIDVCTGKASTWYRRLSNHINANGPAADFRHENKS
jgi:hypothetical protein